MIPAVAIPAAAASAAFLAERGAVVAMRVSYRTGFLDRPIGYKRHGAATPYLGGAAVLLALLVTSIAFSGATVRLSALLYSATALWLVGTVDDLINVAPGWRVLAELGAGAILWSAHLGFPAFGAGAVNLVLTMLWVTAIVNAFNLMDNIDGACAALAAVSTAAIGTIALIHGDTGLTVVSFATTGACLGFLRHNLSGPARIFLGDGGSMPLGFLVAALAMAVVRGHGLSGGELIVCGLLAGLPLLDTTLVMVSRRRRGVALLTGGRDHVTHRLLAKLGTQHRVVLLLVAIQSVGGALAAVGAQAGPAATFVLGAGALMLGVLVVAKLESPEWRPPPVPAAARVTTSIVWALAQRIGSRARAADARLPPGTRASAAGHRPLPIGNPRPAPTSR